jgi:hypothetical protein
LEASCAQTCSANVAALSNSLPVQTCPQVPVAPPVGGKAAVTAAKAAVPTAKAARPVLHDIVLAAHVMQDWLSGLRGRHSGLGGGHSGLPPDRRCNWHLRTSQRRQGKPDGGNGLFRNLSDGGGSFRRRRRRSFSRDLCAQVFSTFESLTRYSLSHFIVPLQNNLVCCLLSRRHVFFVFQFVRSQKPHQLSGIVIARTARSMHDSNVQSEMTKSSSHTHLRTTQQKWIEVKRKPLCPPDVSPPACVDHITHTLHTQACTTKRKYKHLVDITYVYT